MKDQIIKSLKEATGIKNPHLEFSSHEEFGDYTTNIALKSKTPRTEAEKLVGKLKEDKKLQEVVGRIEVAGPGFINFTIKKEALLNELEEALKVKDGYGASEIGKGKTVVVDYSAPNIAKRFSIGHLRSTVIGQALYNLYKFLGYEVVGDNHLGDWGTQFGVLIYMVERENLDPAALTVEDWEKLYIDFHSELEKNPDLKEQARHAFKRLEEKDKSARLIWQAALETSLKEYGKIYDLLGIQIDHAYGESFYEDKISEVLAEAKKKGLAKEGERGALIMEFKEMTPAMLIKADGTTTYFTRDLATIKYRIKTWDPDLFIYEVGSDQTLHFRQVFEAARLLGWIKDQQIVHVAHGLVRFKEGKMSTRRGKTIKLEEVLDEAIEKAGKLQKDRPASAKATAAAVGIGAIKYFDLMHAPTSDIIFDWSKIFVLEGNSGPYLQYTYARTQSVLAKVKSQNSKLKNTSENLKLEIEELMVLRYLIRFSEIVEEAAANYAPNLLANYLFELAQKYNSFYNKHKIIGSQKESFRLDLTKAAGHVLKNGLKLLGIETPSKM